MKTEDIDKRIEMPDVDAEWEKFESEVIGKKATSRKTVWLWSLSIAASIALVAGIFLLNRNSEEPKQLQAKLEEPAKTKEIKEQLTAKEEQPVEQEIESVVEPRKQLAQAEPAPVPETKESDSPITVHHPNDMDLALQGKIAGLNEIPDSVRQARRDSLLRQREINMDSMLIVVNGTPIPLYRFKPNGVAPYLYKQHQLLSDSDLDVEERISRGVYTPYAGSEEERKRRCFDTYGDRAKYGVIEVTTVPDTYCDDYISKHPELKKERQHIEGYVYDEDNKPLADAWVYIRGKGIGAATDSKGYFSIWIPKNQQELWVSCMGYVRVRKAFPSDDSKLIIRMRNATTIKDVKVRVRGQNDNEAKPIPIREITTKDFDVPELDKE